MSNACFLHPLSCYISVKFPGMYSCWYSDYFLHFYSPFRTALSSQYSSAEILRGSLLYCIIRSGKLLLIASKSKPQLKQDAIASTSSLPSLHVHKIILSPLCCRDCNSCITDQLGSPISGYLSEHKQPSKSTAIIFTTISLF